VLLASAAVKDAGLRRNPQLLALIDPQRIALTAGILSFLVAGLGHFLIAQKLRGTIWLGAWLVAGAMIAALGETVAVLAAWLLSVLAGVDAYLLARSRARCDGSPRQDRQFAHTVVAEIRGLVTFGKRSA
jgi:TM2 domain-containing membrane protein YozV